MLFDLVGPVGGSYYGVSDTNVRGTRIVCIAFPFDVLDFGNIDPERKRVGQSNLALECNVPSTRCFTYRA
jgi:hypothetical protein